MIEVDPFANDKARTLAMSTGPNLPDANPTGNAELDARRLEAIHKLERQLTPNEALSLAQSLPVDHAPLAEVDDRTPEEKFAAHIAELSA